MRKGVWELLEYFWPVVAPETGKVEPYTPLPFADRPQYYHDGFTDPKLFKKDMLHMNAEGYVLWTKK